MKTILAVGDLDSFTTVYKASLVAMMAGWLHDSLFRMVLQFSCLLQEQMR